MSANNQIIVAPYPKDLTRYAVWHDSCVDNPFDFGSEPIAIFDDLEEAMTKADQVMRNDIVEYGIQFIPKASVSGYSIKRWPTGTEYTCLTPDGPIGEHDPHIEFDGP
jgi:hypothetical protein